MNIKVKDTDIAFRKWKVKDRDAFVNAQNDYDRRQALVYNCLENKTIALDNEQYNYVLIQIRCESVSPMLHYTLRCPECGSVLDVDVDLREIVHVRYQDFHDIVIPGLKITLAEVKNREAYERRMSETQDTYNKYLIDLAFHINTINDAYPQSFNGVVEFIRDLDVDQFENIFRQWDTQRFKVLMNGDLTCSNCGITTKWNFDDLPGFLPASWL